MERVSRRWATRRIAVVLLLVTAVSTIKGDKDANYGAKRVVRVQNDLDPNNDDDTLLKVECRSKDDDLGIHDLQNGQYFEWSFKMSFIKQTRYWCVIQWNWNPPKQYSFDAFSTKRDALRCSDQCYWSIRPDGAYSYNQYSKIYEKLYTWTS